MSNHPFNTTSAAQEIGKCVKCGGTLYALLTHHCQTSTRIPMTQTSSSVPPVGAGHTSLSGMGNGGAFHPTGGGEKGLSESEDDQIVRRLMPVECERLQGFPDGWTDLGDTPDAPRYSAMGDAVTVNVAEWLGGRL